MNEDIINDLNEELENVIEEGNSRLRQGELSDKIREFTTESELLIRKHPIASVAAGAALGYIIGRIFK